MEKIFPTHNVGATIAFPVTGLLTGTPVLVRRLTAPQRERRAEAAALQARQDELAATAAAEADEEFTKKLTKEADASKRAAMVRARETEKVTARQIRLEQAQAGRAEKRGKLKEAAGAAAVTLLVGGPLIWSLARPLIEPGIGLLIGAWWIAALIHAPAKPKAKNKARADQAREENEDQDDEDREGNDDQEEEYALQTSTAAPAPAAPRGLSDAQLTAAVEHMVALRAQTDDGRGHVHLTEALESLQRHGHYPALTARDFGALVRAAGLPVEPNIRVPGRTPSTGFTAASLATHLRRSPSLPPQAAARAAVDRTPKAA
ncbi:hypothetical protein [Kitasatospora sp. NPDC005856]|uniref:hypothetical protein n=1 Tax=Kitasatospora sp. NPDC005856 TaxID=3154566 RepID=UPI0033C4DD3E